MTIVVSNGFYMIADKRRLSNTHESNRKLSENPEFNKKSIWRKSYDDDIDKLIPLPKDAVYDSKKVLCISGSGSVFGLDAFYKLMHTVSDIKEYFKALHATKGTFGESYTILMMLENNTTVTVRVVHNGKMYHVNTETHAAGDLVMIGTGGTMYNLMLRELGASTEDLFLIELFLFGANSSKGCSFNYDVYGAKENEYYKDRKPGRDAVKEAVTRVLKSVHWLREKPSFIQ